MMARSRSRGSHVAGLVGWVFADTLLVLVVIFLATQTGWLRVHALPSYAYDLNPADGVWGNLKGVDLANRVNTDLDDVERAVARGMSRIRRRPDLLWNFLTRCGLSLPP